jgi:hypothetical protein
MGPEIAAAGAAAGAAGSSAISPTIAAALIGGGTAAQMVAARQQAKQQRSVLNRAFEANDKTTEGGTADVLQEASKAAPGGQAQAMQTAEDAAYERTRSDLTGAGADIIQTAGENGRQSDAFRTALEQKQGQEGDRMSAIAREFARLRAPADVQRDQALSRAALAERIASTQVSNQRRAQAAQLDAQDVETPWYGDVGKIASLVGSVGLGMGGAGSATTTATPTATQAAATGAMAGAGSGVPWWAMAPQAAQMTQRRQAAPTWMGR